MYRGRVLSFRRHGNIAFGQLSINGNEIQFVLKKDLTPDFKKVVGEVCIGCHIELNGEFSDTSTGVFSLFAAYAKVLARPMVGFPARGETIVDPETRLRKRYLDLAVDAEYFKLFQRRAWLIKRLRNLMADYDFVEVDTPVLCPQASGAMARPFITHHNVLDADLYLRIAPETYLKRAVVAGFDRVFELGKQFRNEGIDPSHLQEFTSIEWYVAYWNYRDNLKFFQTIFNKIVNGLLPLNCHLDYQGTKLNFTFPDEILYRDLFHKETGTYPDTMSAKQADEIFKHKVRPKIIQPTYVLDYPAHMSPMAKRKDDDPQTAEQWQFIVNGWELVKCYSELTDPVLQRKLLQEQMEAKSNGDDEAMALEEDFLEALEYGAPPMSGLGMGVDRVVAIMLNQKSLRDVVMFPTVLKR